jgi:predicted ATPase/class 3 adenylate cyclase
MSDRGREGNRVERRLPEGTVTFLFTDIEGSTRLLSELGEAYRAIEDAHARILRRSIDASGGTEVSTEGDSFFAVFTTPTAAIDAAATAQQGLAAEAWPHGAPLRVRMGIHTGEGRLGGDNYLGMDVNRAARIASAANGGQVVVSAATQVLVDGRLRSGVTLRDLGEHRLKDLPGPEHLFDLVIPGLPAVFPPLRTAGPKAVELPAAPTSFVGRQREIGELADLLRTARLVTLTGPGGTGKTRLAIETARRLRGSYPGGVHFVDLTPLQAGELVLSAIAQAVGVIEEPGRPLLDSLTDVLQDRQAMLLLDNFEHLIDAADAVSVLLGGTHDLRLLVTSRILLRVYGEHEYEVAPLELPAGDAPVEEMTAARSPALALFVDRARAVRYDFALTDANALVVAEICRRLDGLPLAIELAASRIKLLPPEAILARLDRRLELLTGGPRSLPERQRTLRATIEWSYDLLNTAEQRLLDRLSVFAAGATLEAIDAVCNPAAETGVETLDGLASLADKSLLRVLEGAGAGEPRYALLETIRELASERLAAAGETPTVERRHAAFFSAFAEMAVPEIVGEQQAVWLERVSSEHDNLRAALRRTIDSADGDTAMRIAGALWRFWQQRGHLSEGRRWCREALVLDASPKARFDALTAAAGLAYWQGDYGESERLYADSLRIAREMGDHRAEALALRNLAFMPLMRDEYAESERLFAESRALSVEIGDREQVASTDGNLGWIYMLEGRFDDSIAHATAAVEFFRERGNRFEIIDNIATLGQAHRLRGELELARARFLEALELLAEAKDQPMTGRTLRVLAATESAAGRHERAVLLWGAAEAIRLRIGGLGPLDSIRVTDPMPAARQAIGDQAAEAAMRRGLETESEGLRTILASD